MLKYMYVYILADKHQKTLHTGVALDLGKGVLTHKKYLTQNTSCKGITLVYYEKHYAPYTAYQRHLDISSLKKKNQIEIIHCFNPAWKDLSATP